MTDESLCACLPNADLAERVRRAVPPPLSVDLVVWDGPVAPDGVERATFFVPPYRPEPPARAVLEALPDLKVVQLLTAGFDGWDELLPPGVLLCNAAGVHGVSTAELAVTLLLASSRDLPGHLQDQHEHVSRRRARIGLTEIPVLVLGAGDIGQRVSSALRPLGAKVTLVGRTARDDVRGIGELQDLLPTHRALVIAIPLTEATRGLIGKDQLAAMPDGSIIVNVARGPIVDTSALQAELTAGRLKAALDVTDPEPLPPAHPLWSMPNLILTPHIGGGTRDWTERAARMIADQLRRLTRGQRPAHVVLG